MTSTTSQSPFDVPSWGSPEPLWVRWTQTQNVQLTVKIHPEMDSNSGRAAVIATALTTSQTRFKYSFCIHKISVHKLEPGRIRTWNVHYLGCYVSAVHASVYPFSFPIEGHFLNTCSNNTNSIRDRKRFYSTIRFEIKDLYSLGWKIRITEIQICYLGSRF